MAAAEAEIKVGVGYRPELVEWLAANPNAIQCAEITAEHFVGRGEKSLERIPKHVTSFVHGLALSLGTPGPLDASRLADFKRVADAVNAPWVSEHVAFTRAGVIDLGHLNPIRPTRESARIVAEHARELADFCARPVILENITSHVRLTGDLDETDFLNEICTRADCGLLLDVTNLYINAHNHGYDPAQWLDRLDVARIRQLHIVGYSKEGDRLVDSHGARIQPELLDLLRLVLHNSGAEAVILERDEHIDDFQEIASELTRLNHAVKSNDPPITRAPR